MDNISDWLYILLIAGGIISTLLPKRGQKKGEPLPDEELPPWEFDPQEMSTNLPPVKQPIQTIQKRKQKVYHPASESKNTLHLTQDQTTIETPVTETDSITPQTEEDWKKAFVSSEILSPKYKEYI